MNGTHNNSNSKERLKIDWDLQARQLWYKLLAAWGLYSVSAFCNRAACLLIFHFQLPNFEFFFRIHSCLDLVLTGKNFPHFFENEFKNYIPIKPVFIENKKKYWGLLGWIGCVSQVINPTNLNISFQFQWKMVVCWL